ncbi:MAG: ABC transporter ATP-binding protein [Pseudonocardia sp. SCN 72-86]|nr:MAG: ABC transporter ATP-binding protein [Pseudonocardia sp. SCN 72-86]
MLLVAAGLRLEFGGVKALDDVSFTVRRREIYAIVGPNGAGKSSALNTISGLYKPRAGSVVFDGQQITGRSAPTLARMGLGRTFQNISLYAGMSVLDNVLTGRTVHMRAGLTRAIVRPWGLREEARHRAAVEEIIDFMRLGAFRHAAVETLGYGIRKRVDLARALAMEPRLLLLDEPMAGMNLEEKEDMARAVLDVRAERSCTLVLVEHDMGVVSDLADRVLVLDWGQVIAEGVAAEVLRLPAVVAAYLGKATV